MLRMFKVRGVVMLGLSNAVSQFGDRLTHMVIVTFIGAFAPGRVSAYSEFSVAFSLPIILLAPFVGIFVDHWNKRSVMLNFHLVQALLIALTPTFINLTHSLIPVWVLVVLFFSLDAFNNTARSTVVPDIVGYQDLVPANALITTMARVATFAGMVGGGYLIKWVGWSSGFYIDASTHACAGILALGIGARIQFEPVKRFDLPLGKRLRGALSIFLVDLKELGLLVARDRAVIFVMISVFALPFVAATSYTLLIYMVQQTFKMGAAGVGLFGGIVGIGMLAGGIAMGFIGIRTARGPVIILATGILAAAFLVGPLLISPLFLYVIAFVAGTTFSFIGISQDTILQEDVMRGIRGRIFSTKEFLTNVVFTISAVLVGITSGRLSPYAIIAVVGVILGVVTVVEAVLYWSIPADVRQRL